MNISEQQTEQLLDRAAEGSESAVRELIISHRARLRRLVSLRLDQRLKGRFDPSDVVQEVLAAAVSRLPSYLENRPIPFYAWLRRLAWDSLIRLHEQHVIAQKRSVTREARPDLELSGASISQLATRLTASSPSHRSMRNELRRRVLEALNQLSHDDRELLMMKHIEELTLAEIAGTLGISMSAVKGRHLRALKRMNDRLRVTGEIL